MANEFSTYYYVKNYNKITTERCPSCINITILGMRKIKRGQVRKRIDRGLTQSKWKKNKEDHGRVISIPSVIASNEPVIHGLNSIHSTHSTIQDHSSATQRITLSLEITESCVCVRSLMYLYKCYKTLN